MSSSKAGPKVLALAVLVVISGCGGSSPAGNLPTATKQAPQRRSREESGDLLYTMGGGASRIFTYPGGKLVASFDRTGNSLEGMCSDRKGNVYVVESPAIYEYAHGGTTPIRSIPNVDAWSCAVDPTTGKLAVTMLGGFQQAPYLAVYTDASGIPAAYPLVTMTRPYNCVYDDKGNLFIQGVLNERGSPNVLDELPEGANSLVNIKLSTRVADVGGPTGIAWDGKYVVLGDTGQDGYRFKIQKQKGTLVGETTFNGVQTVYQFWLQGSLILLTDERSGDVNFYKYPSGGNATKVVSAGANDAAVSLAPSR